MLRIHFLGVGQVRDWINFSFIVIRRWIKTERNIVLNVSPCLAAEWGTNVVVITGCDGPLTSSIEMADN